MFVKSPAIISPIGTPFAGFTPGNKTPPTRTLSAINTVLFGIGSVKNDIRSSCVSYILQ